MGNRARDIARAKTLVPDWLSLYKSRRETAAEPLHAMAGTIAHCARRLDRVPFSVYASERLDRCTISRRLLFPLAAQVPRTAVWCLVLGMSDRCRMTEISAHASAPAEHYIDAEHVSSDDVGSFMVDSTVRGVKRPTPCGTTSSIDQDDRIEDPDPHGQECMQTPIPCPIARDADACVGSSAGARCSLPDTTFVAPPRVAECARGHPPEASPTAVPLGPARPTSSGLGLGDRTDESTLGRAITRNVPVDGGPRPSAVPQQEAVRVLQEAQRMWGTFCAETPPIEPDGWAVTREGTVFDPVLREKVIHVRRGRPVKRTQPTPRSHESVGNSRKRKSNDCESHATVDDDEGNLEQKGRSTTRNPVINSESPLLGLIDAKLPTARVIVPDVDTSPLRPDSARLYVVARTGIGPIRHHVRCTSDGLHVFLIDIVRAFYDLWTHPDPCATYNVVRALRRQCGWTFARVCTRDHGRHTLVVPASSMAHLFKDMASVMMHGARYLIAQRFVGSADAALLLQRIGALAPVLGAVNGTPSVSLVYVPVPRSATQTLESAPVAPGPLGGAADVDTAAPGHDMRHEDTARRKSKARVAFKSLDTRTSTVATVAVPCRAMPSDIPSTGCPSVLAIEGLDGVECLKETPSDPPVHDGDTTQAVDMAIDGAHPSPGAVGDSLTACKADSSSDATRSFDRVPDLKRPLSLPCDLDSVKRQEQVYNTMEASSLMRRARKDRPLTIWRWVDKTWRLVLIFVPSQDGGSGAAHMWHVKTTSEGGGSTDAPTAGTVLANNAAVDGDDNGDGDELQTLATRAGAKSNGHERIDALRSTACVGSRHVVQTVIKVIETPTMAAAVGAHLDAPFSRSAVADAVVTFANGWLLATAHRWAHCKQSHVDPTQILRLLLDRLTGAWRKAAGTPHRSACARITTLLLPLLTPPTQHPTLMVQTKRL